MDSYPINSSDPSFPLSTNSAEWLLLSEKPIPNIPSESKYLRSFLSNGHFIVLYSQRLVFLFDLKTFKWSKPNVKFHTTKEMTSDCCFVKSGLIISLNLTLERNYTKSLELLTFDDDFTNFTRKSVSLEDAEISFRMNYSLNGDSNNLYIFGGTLGDFKDAKAYNDLLILDTRKNAIFEAKIPEPKPKARHGHSSALADEKLYITGGKESNGNFLSDLWVIDLKSAMKWQRLHLNFNIPGVLNKNTTIQIRSHKILLLNVSDRSLIIYDTKKEEQDKIDLPEHNALFSKEIQIFPCYRDSVVIGSNLNLFYFPFKKNSQPKPISWNFKPDVVFKIEDEELIANKEILSQRCSYFQKVFSSNMMESHNKQIEVKDVKASVFKEVLRYIEKGEVNITNENMVELFRLADEYQLIELKEQCEEFMMEELRIESVLEVIKIAELFELEDLRKAALHFIARDAENMERFLQAYDLKKLDKNLILELFQISR